MSAYATPATIPRAPCAGGGRDVGYHFTPRDTWVGVIRHKGLVPYPLAQPGVVAEFRAAGREAVGIWLWPKPPTGVDLLGSLMDRVLRHRAPRVVMLEVTFDPAWEVTPDMLSRGHVRVSGFTHRGALSHASRAGNWVYHEAAPFRLLGTPVPPDRLRVVGDWDVPALFESAYAPGILDRAGEIV